MLLIWLFFQNGWFTENAGWLISLIVLFVSGIGWAFRLEAMLKQAMDNLKDIKQDMSVIESEFHSHTKNNDAHVNLPYMKSMERRMDQFETTMSKGFDKLSEKVDALRDEQARR